MLRFGKVDITITTAEPEKLLKDLAQRNVVAYHIIQNDEITVTINAKATMVDLIKETVLQRKGKIEKMRYSDRVATIRSLLHRPILLLGLVFWVLLIVFLPSRILFVQVEGNESISDLQIIESAEKCGIKFGASRRFVRSEEVKNSLILEIPQLQWAGVNTRGCLAVISVNERSQPAKSSQVDCVGHIVAQQDGVISNMITTKGTPLCMVGQAVTKGQVLVSGYTDCGFVLRAERAEAEVLAVTERRITARIPNSFFVRKEKVHNWTDCSIQIGKSVVKLVRKREVESDSTVKVYEKYYLTLPGGFRLPVALVLEKYCDYTVVTDVINVADDIPQIIDAYLKRHLIIGRVLSSQFLEFRDNEMCGFHAVFVCEEVIGRFQREELDKHYGK